MFDGWEDVKRVVHHQGLSYVPEVIRIELNSRHHDKGTLASIQLKNSLPENLRETCNRRYQYLLIDQSRLGRDCLCLSIRRTQVTTWVEFPMSTNWKNMSYDSVFIVVRLMKITLWTGANNNQCIRTIKGIKQRLQSAFHAQINRLIKMIYDEPVQITSNALGLAEVFIDLIAWYNLLRPPRLNCTLRLSCHLKVLVFFFVLLPRH